MSINDDSSTVLSVRGSEVLGQTLDNQADKTSEVPDFYGKSYASHP
jgi:hypothetical protein